MHCGNDRLSDIFHLRFVAACVLAIGALFFIPDDLRAGVQGKGIFASTIVQGNLKILKRWQEIMRIGDSQFAFFATCNSGDKKCPAASVQWRKLSQNIRQAPELKKLQQVNTFFNRWPYILDMDLYDVSDYWAAPLEFITNSGDCEDYAITKYFALKKIGINPSTMRIVILKDIIRNITHAVLTVTIKKTSYVLDSLSGALFPDTLYTHYKAQFSFNEQTLQLHLYPHPTLAQ